MKGHALSDDTRRRAASIIITHPTASINKLAQLTDLPHGTVGNLRLDCVRRGLVRPLRDENRLTPAVQQSIVAEYRSGNNIRGTARRTGMSYYAVRLVLEMHDVGLRTPRRLPRERPREASLPIGGDVLDVLCWCEETVVKVERTNVLRGLTRSCGRSGCGDKAIA